MNLNLDLTKCGTGCVRISNFCLFKPDCINVPALVKFLGDEIDNDDGTNLLRRCFFGM